MLNTEQKKQRAYIGGWYSKRQGTGTRTLAKQEQGKQ